ncbi:DNA polymerase III subunit gamma/tau [Pseudoclavibacter triregionum]|nr:DNA polymerase III subunit gamma/tau [Pseudoclavibacter triregionum]
MVGMATALYRRYRPDTFAGMIGQQQVTGPLMTALRTGRVNHAYLFSGPRGCGKTSSARILARCLNCEQGPTDTPCGECDSCRELARDGGGSLDVIEIDAASHGGVDDARDLRDRAVLAPSRDRYKIFIIDEAHMVSSAGFNALLKVVEEPPEHVRFVFATTEPEKVIGTIRSRTHHFPFRLIPPALMLEYVEKLCGEEGVTADPGVLPLVVRAGGGSARDTLSLLDQIIGGSEGDRIDYERAAALLGFTSTELLDATIAAFAAQDAAQAYLAIDRVIQSGQDPRRFVEDLLERVRDLIVVAATGEGAGAVLRGTSADEVERLRGEASGFSPAGLAGMADLIDATLTEMSGVTSPRLHLELMVARILVAMRARFAGAGTASSSALASAPAQAAAPAQATAPAPSAAPMPTPSHADEPSAAAGERELAAASEPRPASLREALGADGRGATPAAESKPADPKPAAELKPVAAPTEPAAEQVPPAPQPKPADESAKPAAPSTSEAAAGTASAPAAERDPASVSPDQFRHAWPSILEHVKQHGRLQAWTIVSNIRPRAYQDGILDFEAPNAAVLAEFKERGAEHVRAAVRELLGIQVKFRPVVVDRRGPSDGRRARPAPAADEDPSRGGSAAGRAPAQAPAPSRPAPSGAAPSRTTPSRPGQPAADLPSGPFPSWNVVPIPGSEPKAEEAPGSAWDEVATGPKTPPEPEASAAPVAVRPGEVSAAVEAEQERPQESPAPDDEQPASALAGMPSDDEAPEIIAAREIEAREAENAPQPFDPSKPAPADARIAAATGAAPFAADAVPPAETGIEAPEEDEPPFDDESPFDDEPPFDPDYDAPGASPAGPSIPAAPAAASATAPASAPSTPAPSTAAATPADAPGTGPSFERYGEAVIREQLGARFVGEDPILPPAPVEELEPEGEEA